MSNIEIKIIAEGAFPEYATSGSSGMDVMAQLKTKTQVIKPGETVLISTGFALNIKDPKICAVLLPRSGLGHKHGIVLGNLVGLIDSDYQGEVFVSCWNRSDKNFTIEDGDRIAQMVFLPVVLPKFSIVKEFDKSERGAGGFGSTGK